jgi:hypothetical protein
MNFVSKALAICCCICIVPSYGLADSSGTSHAAPQRTAARTDDSSEASWPYPPSDASSRFGLRRLTPPQPSLGECTQAPDCACIACCSTVRAQSADAGGFWARADLLYWWIQSYAVPPLATASDSAPSASTGSLLDPNAHVVLGDDRLNGDGRLGYRLRFGYWLDDCETYGIEAEFFGLENGGTSARVVPGGGNLLYRPFFNADPVIDAQDAELADEVTVGSSTSLYSAAVVLRRTVWCCYNQARCRGYFVDLVGGYRFFGLDDTLTVAENTAVPRGRTVNLVDVFDTENQFHGGEIGLVGQYYRGPWLIEGFAKLALGNNHESVRINGYGTTTATPGPPLPTPGGFFAQPTNVGSYNSDHFALIPQFGLAASRQLAGNLTVTAGYTFMWISHAVRPGDQMDFAIDGRWLDPNFAPPGVPAAVRPAPRFVGSSFWVQGINIGLEWKY